MLAVSTVCANLVHVDTCQCVSHHEHSSLLTLAFKHHDAREQPHRVAVDCNFFSPHIWILVYFLFDIKGWGLINSVFKKTINDAQQYLLYIHSIFRIWSIWWSFLFSAPLSFPLPLCADHVDCHLDECHRYQWSRARWVSRRRHHTVITVWVRF